MIPDKVVFNNAIEENDKRLENIIDTLKHYPFVEKMTICQSYATQLMDTTKLSLFDNPNIIYPWELQVFAEFALFADGDNADKSFRDDKGSAFFDIINTIRNYEHPFLKKRKDVDFVNAYIMATGLQQFRFQENILYRLYRYNYFWNFANKNVDMPSAFSQKYDGLCYSEFQELAALIFFFGSFKAQSNIIVKIILQRYRSIIEHLKITREEYKCRQSDKNDDNFDNAVYGFNYLHSFPFVEFQNTIFFPLPYLIIDATTDSLLTRATYDDNHLRENIGLHVAQTYIESIFKECGIYEEVLPESEYRIKKRKIDSPDIMIKNGDDFCFIDTKLSTPKLEIRKFNQEEIDLTIGRYAKNVIQMYSRIKDFINGHYYPFADRTTVNPMNIYGIVAVLEEAYISRRQIYSEVIKKLGIDSESDEAKYIQEHIKFTNFKDLELFAFHSQDIFVALKEKAKNPKDWNDMGLYNSQYYGNKESNRISSLEDFISAKKELFMKYINEMTAYGLIPK